MVKQKGLGQLSPKVAAVIGIILCAAAGLAILAGVLYWNAGRLLETPLQPPQHSVTTSTENLTIMLAIALQQQHATTNRYPVRVHSQERVNFRMHFENAAARRGWYAHSTTDFQIRIVLPEEELRYLEELQDDPIGWIRQESNKTGPAKGPTSLKLTNASIHIYRANFSGKQNMALTGAIGLGGTLGLVGIILLVTPAIYYFKAVIGRRQARI